MFPLLNLTRFEVNPILIFVWFWTNKPILGGGRTSASSGYGAAAKCEEQRQTRDWSPNRIWVLFLYVQGTVFRLYFAKKTKKTKAKPKKKTFYVPFFSLSTISYILHFYKLIKFSISSTLQKLSCCISSW